MTTPVPDTRGRLKKLIAEALSLNEDDLGPNPARYRTPGWDSLVSVEILVAVEEEFDVRLPDSVAVSCDDLVSLSSAVDARRDVGR